MKAKIATIEEQRQQALQHYEEAAKAINHWSSFVVKAIEAYNPASPSVLTEEKIIEVLNKYTQLMGVTKAGEARLGISSQDYNLIAFELLALQPEAKENAPLMGWICPRCGTVYSPFVLTCGCPPPTITSTSGTTE